MLRPARKGTITFPYVIGFFIVVIFLALGIWCYVNSRPPESPFAEFQPELVNLDRNFLDAIRDGDHEKVQKFLKLGANANLRDEAGDTALMRAALFSDAPMMQLLLTNGADVRARAQDGTPPLIRTTHDIEKMRLLLDRGVPADDFAMVATASVPGCRKSLELLVSHGAKVPTSGSAYSPLMAAAGNGDLEAVQFLLDHGANAKGKTPTGFTVLIGAALSGNAKVVALLLERGADPNAVCKLERGILQTPAGVAANMGHADCLKLLMDAGADVNVQGGPFKHNALLGAATTSSKETVKLLLTKADVTAKDWNDNTALDWAKRSGETEIVKMLRAAVNDTTKPATEPIPQKKQATDVEAVRRAVTTALPLLQQSERTITETRSCLTCHQHPLVSMTVGLAKIHGFKVDEKIASDERVHTRNDLKTRQRQLLLGTGIDPTLSVHLLLGLEADGEPASRASDALLHYLVLRQRMDGRWQQENYRPPDEASDFHFTAFAVRGLQTYAAKGRTQEITARIERARRWLQATEPVDTTDRVFQLLGLGWAKAEPAVIEKAVKKLLSEQRDDGGWSQLPTMSSDAYATGLALYSLQIAGGIAVDHPAYKRGVEFLLRTQKEDGSWFVATRSFPFVEFTKSDFPHGRSQFISASATCWATMALTLTTPLSNK